jgi:hypothetical protein
MGVNPDAKRTPRVHGVPQSSTETVHKSSLIHPCTAAAAVIAAVIDATSSSVET